MSQENAPAIRTPRRAGLSPLPMVRNDDHLSRPGTALGDGIVTDCGCRFVKGALGEDARPLTCSGSFYVIIVPTQHEIQWASFVAVLSGFLNLNLKPCD
ncbi:hypothetical protein Bpfe_030814 [Biomphalaria pfeifferi]|uniref:Uncharacterized protein n=1 Tax=Biomphalaria pfeifferi TaxID=112525 RepID=A0AAD8AQM2_BIOPF|nr:hypothetical protein Bpfe_030814 [Biomphalaria pfeifferi]